MTSAHADEGQLDELLDLVAQEIDLDHVDAVDRRYRAALDWHEVDQPPLVVQAAFASDLVLPAPWDRFRQYPYRQAFDDPVAMLQNMLLARVVPGLILKDDNPLAVRNDHGTIQIATFLGASWQMHGDNYPWIEPICDVAVLKRIARAGEEIDWTVGVAQSSIRTLECYRHKLAQYPPCDRAIQISLPDLQGPIDTAEQLRGSDLFLDFYDDPDLVADLMARVVDVTLAVADRYRPFTVDRLDPRASTQHGYVVPGRLMIRNDTAIMLPAEMYVDHVREHDARLLRGVGGGTIHFCGDGQHLIEAVLEIDDLRGFDFGQSEMMDFDAIYEMCRRKRIPMTNLRPERNDLITGRAVGQYPTGVVMVYITSDIDDAKQVVAAHHEHATSRS
ncbi:MAG: hypothetical protein CMJ21_03615 [Phycisphaerae bacterium]|nr:hypothetical protein [Phycisphaerae bacterium]MDP6152198.1 hypothetical protein [Phycisphaeraceae bacterium]MDP7347386.1 hypothetical protein [Phycisphaeraceae bacterium]